MPKTIWILIQPSLSLLSCQGCLNLLPYPVLVRGEGGAIWASTGGVHSSSTWLPACLLPATKYLRDLSLYFWTAQIEVAPHKTHTVIFQCQFIHSTEYFTYPDPGVKVVPSGQVQLLGFTPAPQGLFSEFRICREYAHGKLKSDY